MAGPTRRSRSSHRAVPASSQKPDARGPLVAFLQPIVSVRQRETRLVEALARRLDPGGIVRTPSYIFTEAADEGTQHEVSRQCRQAALKAFRSLGPDHDKLVLSINTDTALVRQGVDGAKLMLSEVLEHAVAPEHVALELLESALPDAIQLEAFCRAARAFGFLLALDDMGAGHSNLERIPRLQPDILKVDRGLVHGMSHSFHQREVFRALSSLSHQIGALVIAEGVESEADVQACLLLGCDLFQGYYFGRPWDPTSSQPMVETEHLERAARDLRTTSTKRLHELRARHRRNEQAMRALLTMVKAVGEPAFEGLLEQTLTRLPHLEALYVLNEQGTQVTPTIARVADSSKALYRPAPRGADQSLKPYYLMLQAGLDRFTSDPYISNASGTFCVTMSRHFVNVLGQGYVLCCDFAVPRDPVL